MSAPKVTLDLQRLRDAARLPICGKTPDEFLGQVVELVAEALDHSDGLDPVTRNTLAARLHTVPGMLCAQALRIDELAVYELEPPRR